MNVLHLLTAGGIGGIESLCKDIAQYSRDNNFFAFVFFGGTICDEMRKNGVNVIEYNSRKFERQTLNKLVNLCRKEKIAVIQVHHRDMFLYWFCIQLHKKLSNIKIITTVHSCYEKGFYYPKKRVITIALMNYFVKKMFKISDAIVYVSEAGYRSFLNFDSTLISGKPKYVVYNGISPIQLDKGVDIPREKKDGLSVSYIGRIEEFKGIRLLISAVLELKDKVKINVKIAGNGKNLEEYKNLVLENKCGDIIEFLGILRGQELERLREKTDFFIYPSTWQEIFGISIIEAMACGLVPIVNMVGGIPEIVDETCAIINDDISVEGIKSALLKAEALDKSEYRILSENAKKRAKDFSIENTIEQLSYVYRRI